MKISFTYETQVTVMVDLDSRSIESVTVPKTINSLAGVNGYTHASRADPGPFTREDTKNAVNVLRDGLSRAKWKFVEGS